MDVVGSGVASVTAVPKTPARVASPSAAACDTDEILGEDQYQQGNPRISGEKSCLRLFVWGPFDGRLVEDPVNQLPRQEYITLMCSALQAEEKEVGLT